MKAVTVPALLASMVVATIAQAEVYKWQDELCDIQGNFDNKKIHRQANRKRPFHVK